MGEIGFDETISILRIFSVEKAKEFYLKPGVQQAPWNARLMEVTDPFGNRIRFNEYNSTP